MRPPLSLCCGLALLAACGSDGEAPADGAAAGGLAEAPSEYSYDPGEEASDDFSAEEAGQAIDDFIAVAFELNAAPVFAAYDGAMAHADETCPAYYEQDGNVFWYSFCTSESGASYDGYGFTYVYEDTELLGEGGGVWDAVVLSGAADITEPDGSTFHFGGTAYLAEGWNEAYSADTWYSAVAGAFVWDSPEAGSTWISEGASPAWAMYLLDSGQYGKAAYLSGSAVILGGSASAIDVGELGLYASGWGFPCELEPAGTISVRSQQGTWVDVVYDVDGATWGLSGECDGCGEGFVEGESIGQVCSDFSGLLAWDGSPW